MICPICKKGPENRNRIKGTEHGNLLAHVRHMHTDYENHLEAAGSVSHLLRNRIKREYNKIAKRMIEEAK